MFSRRWLWKHVVAVLLFAVCVAGAWWQTARAGSPTGTWQNAGYALEWPLFAAFVVFAWFRMMQLEARALASKDTEPEPEPVAVKTPVAAVDEEDDPALAKYNDYLAWLAKQDG
jgi:DNA-binding transcriptional regulator of glucitol operon